MTGDPFGRPSTIKPLDLALVSKLADRAIDLQSRLRISISEAADLAMLEWIAEEKTIALAAKRQTSLDTFLSSTRDADYKRFREQTIARAVGRMTSLPASNTLKASFADLLKAKKR